MEVLNNYQNNNNTNNECQVYATRGRLRNGKENHRLQATPSPNRVNNSRVVHIKVRSVFLFVLRRVEITVSVHYQTHTGH